MRRTPLLIAAVSLVAAATPAALLAHGSADPKGKSPEVHHPEKAKDHRGTHYLFLGCVTTDATETGVALSVKAANRAARKSLADATTFTATLNADTKVRLVGKARKVEEGKDGKHGKRLPRTGTWDNLDTGDVVMVRYRAARGTLVADLGAAKKVIDFGPRPKWCAVPDPTTPDPKTPETPTTTTPTTTAPAS